MARILTLLVVLFVSFVSSASAQDRKPGLPFGPPPIIEGQLLSVNSQLSEFPISAEGWGVYLQLFKSDGFAYSWVNGSDCYFSGQGCPDQMGQFNFSWDFAGDSLSCGNYKITAEVEHHMVGYAYFLVPCTGVAKVKMFAQISPVSITLFGGLGDIPREGGSLGVYVRVCRLDTNAETYPAYGTIFGPGRTQQWVAFQVELSPIVLPTETWRCNYQFLSYYIDGSYPEGSYQMQVGIGSAIDPVSLLWSGTINKQMRPQAAF